MNKEKLLALYEELLTLNGRKYSELSLNEKRLVEMFCSRVKVTDAGVPAKDGQYQTLAVSMYAKYMLKEALGDQVTVRKPQTFNIVEDVELDFEELYGRNLPKARMKVMEDALDSYPDNYMPIRRYKGKVGVMYMFWLRSKGYYHNTSNEKSPFLGTEVKYNPSAQFSREVVKEQEMPRFGFLTENDIYSLLFGLVNFNTTINPVTAALVVNSVTRVNDSGIPVRSDEFKEIANRVTDDKKLHFGFSLELYEQAKDIYEALETIETPIEPSLLDHAEAAFTGKKLKFMG